MTSVSIPTPLKALALAVSLSLLGAIAGYVSLWSVWWLFKQLTGKEGMGHGDFKLLAAIGAWTGLMGILPTILLSSLVGAIVGSLWLWAKGRDRATPIPFGPYLAVAGWIIFAILALSVILNAITPSVLERAIWLPVTLLLAAATLVIALAPQ